MDQLLHQLPKELQARALQLVQIMQQQPDHLLLPQDRLYFYEAVQTTVGDQANRLIMRLGQLAVERVLPLWHIPLFMVEEHEAEYAEWFRWPQTLVEFANEMHMSSDRRAEAERQFNHVREVSDLTGQPPEAPYYHAWCVLEAALWLLQQALYPGSWARRDWAALGLTAAEDFLWYGWDTVGWACVAETGGRWSPADRTSWAYEEAQARWVTTDRGWYFKEYGQWDRVSEPARMRRQVFWEWCFLQALPQAWLQTL